MINVQVSAANININIPLTIISGTTTQPSAVSNTSGHNNEVYSQLLSALGRQRVGVFPHYDRLPLGLIVSQDSTESSNEARN